MITHGHAQIFVGMVTYIGTYCLLGTYYLSTYCYNYKYMRLLTRVYGIWACKIEILMGGIFIYTSKLRIP